jgi:uncharacterized repeat protein (TIGR01451 family)
MNNSVSRGTARRVRGVLGPLVVILLALTAGTARAQVVFDAASNASPATASAGNPITVSWNHTVALAKKPFLVVGVSLKLNGGGATVSGVTYGSEAGGQGQVMTLINAATNGTNARAELWGLAGPTAGTHQITVTVANGGGQNVVVVAGAKSFTNVFQSASNGAAVTATGNSVTPSVTVANSAFDYVVDAVAYNGNQALAAGANQTNTYNVTSAAPTFSGAGSAKTGFANTTMTWTGGVAQQWAAIAVPLQSANPQILFDAASNVAAATTSAANPVNVSWAHSTTTAANRYIVVAVTMQMAGVAHTVTSVTYGTEGGGPNQAMALIRGQSRTTNNNVRVELWGLASPASGTHTITAAIGNAGGQTLTVVAGAQTFSNVDQTAPLGTSVSANNTSTTPAVAVVNGPYDYVVDGVAYNSNVALAPTVQQDQRFQVINTPGGGNNFNGTSSGLRGYTNPTMQWTGANSSSWAIVAVPLKQVTVGLKKTASADVVNLGQTITYTLTATNYTSATVNNVIITDPIPAGAAFVSQSGCAGSGPVTCNIGTLAAGATSAPITVTVVANAAGPIANAATVSFNGLAQSNSSETVTTMGQAKVCASPGKDGAGGTLAGVKNDYWPGSASVAAGATTLTVGARSAGSAGNNITAGDLLIVMQMQDAAFDNTNDETYGEGTGSTGGTGTGSGAATTLNNAGRWEYAVATNTVTNAGGAVNFTAGGAGGGLLYGYTNQAFAATTTQGQRRYQVIRVPQYTTATLGSTLTALTWNGNTGGVLAIDVSGTLALGTATVSVNGLGFRGGAGRVLTGVGAGTGLLPTDFRTSAALATNGSKGEGIAGSPQYIYQHGAAIGAPGSGNAPLNTGVEGYVGGSYGRGAPGNAGGGSTDGDPPANDDNSGGGGGGNGGFGGAGGNGWNCNCPSGGQGGGAISPSLTRFTMGGGGGSGTTNNASGEICVAPPTCRVNVPGDWADDETGNGYYSSGANGGGVVIIRALQATGTGTITANGFTAYNTGRDGAGGGGAGGSVLVTTQLGTLGGLTIQAKGGNGGNAWLTTAPAGTPGERHGPGGGGGGGFVLLSSAAASTDVSAGANGVTNSSNDPYGAQPGTIGLVQMMTSSIVLPGGDGATCSLVDLAVTNVANPTAVQAGNNITFTQSVVNNGPNAADGVVYMAPIPASTTFVSMSVPAGWTCITPAVGGTGVVTCTTPTMNASTTANFSLVVNSSVATPAGYLTTETNSVSCNTPESNSANNQATASVLIEASATAAPFADMAVTIAQSTNYPTAGSNINYTQTISNLGSFTAQTPSYTFTTPPNTTFQSITPPAGWTCITPAVNGTGTINCSGTTLASGASVSMPLTLKVNAGTSVGTAITATPTVSSTSRDPYTPNNTASVTATVVAAGSGDVGVTISNSPDPVSPGQNYSYTVVATNGGPAAAANVSVSIPLPPGTTNFRSLTVPPGWACGTPAVGAGGTITCTIASLAAGASATFSPVVQVNYTTANGTTLSCMTSISTTSTDNIASNNNATATNLVTASTNADVAIVKTASPNPVGEGQLITFRLTVTNNGPAIATNVTINDPLPAGLTFESASPSIGSCAGTTTISCSLGTLPVGNSQYVDIIVQAGNPGTVSNTATVSATQTDPVPANNSSTANTTVLAVTLIRLRDLHAEQDDDRVLVSWQTSFEQDNLGFNVYRDLNGTRTKLNKNLIAGTAIVSKRQDSTSGSTYRLYDKLDSHSSVPQYLLEDVDLKSVHTMHGPVSPGGSIQQPPPPASATPLPGLGQQGSVFESQKGYGVARDYAFGATDSKGQQLLVQSDGLKIYVTKEGWHHVSSAAIRAAGLKFDSGDSLALFTGGNSQPIVSEGDGISFFGYPLDTAYTGARTYWLTANGNHKRLGTSRGKGAAVTGSIPFTFTRTERSIFFAALLTNGDAESMFGPVITNEPTPQTLTVAGVDTAFGGTATLEVTLQGGTESPHAIDVLFNGQRAGTAALPSQALKTFSYSIPHSWVTAGANTVTFTALNGDNDVSFLVTTRLTYQHALRAETGALEVSLPSGRSATVGGFANNSIRALDVTDPLNPSAVETTVAADPAGGFAATFGVPSGGNSRTILVADSTRTLTPDEMAFYDSAASTVASGSGNSNGNGNGNNDDTTTTRIAPDLIILTNSAFTSAASTLVPVRAAQGISSSVVQVDDVYDTFNFGVRDPRAIRAYLQSFGQSKNGRAPRWVLLVGDASVDPRNYFGLGAFDFLPTKLVLTTQIKTASDDWYTDFNGDGTADIPIGRISARTAAEAALQFKRITQRGTPSGAWASSALFIADFPNGYNFAGAAAAAAAVVPSSMTKQTIAFAASSNPHADVVNALNNGALIVDYVGHGSTEIWGESVFGSGDAAALSNGSRLPFAVLMTCLNGYFHDVYSGSMAESLMRAPNGGAIAVWASSTLTQPDQQSIMNRELFRILFSNPTITLGEAVMRAKAVASDADLRKSWILFGDPSMRLR